MDQPLISMLYHLSGPFGTLPLEILVDAIVIMDVRSIANLLATGRALNSLYHGEGIGSTMFYRKLYHALIKSISKYDRPRDHSIYSPKADPGQSLHIFATRITRPLPEGHIWDWKVQYTSTAIWSLSLAGGIRACSICFKTSRRTEIKVESNFRMSACLECLATNLVIKSITKQYVPTADLIGLPTAEIRVKATSTQSFYSGQHLLALAQQKYGRQIVGPTTSVNSSRLERETIVKCAELMAGGELWSWSYAAAFWDVREMAYVKALQAELSRYIRNTTEAQDMGVRRASHYPQNRKIGDILTSLRKMIEAYNRSLDWSSTSPPIEYRADAPVLPSPQHLERFKFFSDNKTLDFDRLGRAGLRLVQQYVLDTRGYDYREEVMDELFELDPRAFGDRSYTPASEPIDKVETLTYSIKEATDRLETHRNSQYPRLEEYFRLSSPAHDS